MRDNPPRWSVTWAERADAYELLTGRPSPLRPPSRRFEAAHGPLPRAHRSGGPIADEPRQTTPTRRPRWTTAPNRHVTHVPQLHELAAETRPRVQASRSKRRHSPTNRSSEAPWIIDSDREADPNGHDCEGLSNRAMQTTPVDHRLCDRAANAVAQASGPDRRLVAAISGRRVQPGSRCRPHGPMGAPWLMTVLHRDVHVRLHLTGAEVGSRSREWLMRAAPPSPPRSQRTG